MYKRQGPGYGIKGEFASNGVNNPIRHTRGVISMARSSMPNSAGSQFFIMHADAPHLDGDYAAFGHVVSGMDVVDEIAATPTDWRDKPTTPVVMKTAVSYTHLDVYKRQMMYSRKPDPQRMTAAANANRTSVGSTLKYSATPPQTPNKMREPRAL